MDKSVKRLLGVVLLSAGFAGLIGYITYGKLEHLTSESFVDVMGVLLNISSIIFAIIGAWIAIVYPKIIQSALVGDSRHDSKSIEENNKDADYLSSLFEIVFLSSVVIIFAVSAQVALPIIKSYSYFGLSDQMVRLFGAMLMLFFGSVQMVSIFLVVLKNYQMLQRARQKNSQDTLMNDI